MSTGFPRTPTNSSGAGGDGRYRRKVGFEAFEAGPEALFAYTCAVSIPYGSAFSSSQTWSSFAPALFALRGHSWIAGTRLTLSQAKSEGYKRSRNTRVFAVAVSADESGEDALDWLMSELVEDGDEVVAIRVIELDEGGESFRSACCSLC